MIHVHKEYQEAFLLEPTKLGRLVDKIHERLGDHQNTTPHDTFEVFLTGNRREEMTTLDQVLALDNSSRHRITRLVITCSASTLGATRPEHEVQVDFARPNPATRAVIRKVSLLAFAVTPPLGLAAYFPKLKSRSNVIGCITPGRSLSSLAFSWLGCFS